MTRRLPALLLGALAVPGCASPAPPPGPPPETPREAAETARPPAPPQPQEDCQPLTGDAKAPWEVPGGGAVSVDGKYGAGEWKGALALSQGGLRLRLRHEGRTLYVAVDAPGPSLGTEEFYLLVDADGSGGETPGKGDLQFSVNPHSLLRMPWMESQGDGSSWIEAPAPEGWTASVAAAGDRILAEFALPDARLPSRSIRLGVLVSGTASKDRLVLPEGLNLYTPDSWMALRLPEPSGSKGAPELDAQPDRLARARQAREFFKTVRVREEELSKRKEPPKTQAEALSIQQALQAMIQGLDKAVELEPENPFLRFSRSSFRSNYMGDFDGAVEDLEVSRREAPGDRRLLLQLVQAYQMTNRHASALALADALVAQEPDQPQGVLVRGQLRMAIGEFDGAAEDFKKAAGFPLDSKNGQMVDGLLAQAEALRKDWAAELELRKRDEAKGDLPRVQIETAQGKILVELFEDDAPNTVANFLSLVQTGFFAGTRFHRVLPDFMAQGGDPLSRNPEDPRVGQGGPGYFIKTQISVRKHFRGVISMAHAKEMDTDGSQFFLTVRPTPWLDGKHAVFGRILEGQDVADRLRAGDLVLGMKVVRKRDHPYVPEKIDRPAAP